MAPIMAHLRVCHNLVDFGKRWPPTCDAAEIALRSSGLTVRPCLKMLSDLPAVYQDRPEPQGLRRTQTYSMRVRTRTGRAADTDVQLVYQSSGFLNRVRWFDSGRGHAFESRRATRAHEGRTVQRPRTASD